MRTEVQRLLCLGGDAKESLLFSRSWSFGAMGGGWRAAGRGRGPIRRGQNMYVQPPRAGATLGIVYILITDQDVGPTIAYIKLVCTDRTRIH
jgi:hypothetical protein